MRAEPLKVACIIPARGGSRGLPRKNVLPFAGRPLLAWSVQRALQCGAVNAGTWVSTDDDEIAGVARHYGAEVIRRPSELAGDRSPSEDAVLHAVPAIEKAKGPLDAVVMLQATSPLRLAEDLGRALAQFDQQRLDSLFSGTDIDDVTMWARQADGLRSVTYDWKSRGMRQTRVPHVLENGSFYVSRVKILTDTRNRLGGAMGYFPMPGWQALEIDDAEDFALCEALAYHYGLTWGSRVLPKDLAAVVMDFDGVFTDNGVYVDDQGKETVRCSRGDGLAISLFRQARPGIPIVILSAEVNPVVQARAKKLKIEAVTGEANKVAALESLCAAKGWPMARVVYVGNDLNDLECMRRAGYSMAPADAAPAVRSEADLVLEHAGGNGAVREACERVIGAKFDTRGQG